jgi:hypothetical protein
MSLSRITSTLGAAVLGAVLVASTYGSVAAGTTTPAHHARTVVHYPYAPPMVHKYLPNGMRMGLHCDTGLHAEM